MNIFSNDTVKGPNFNMDDADADVCRVCRMEGTSKRALFHPCHCSGSIRYVHQECLIEWLRVSKKDYCELCKHKFTFKPIYAADMPARIPISDLLTGLFRSLLRAIGCWLHYTTVALAWLGFVPLVTCRIYYCLFSGTVSSVLRIPNDLFSTENFMRDIITGCFIVGCTMGIFVCLLYLREQFMQGAFQQFMHPNIDENGEVGGANDDLDQLDENEQEQINFDEIERLVNDIEVNERNDEENVLINDGQFDEEEEEDDDDDEDDEPIEIDASDDDVEGNEVEDPLDDQNEPQVNQQMDIIRNEANVLFNEAENPEPAEQWNLEELTWERMLGLDGSFVFLEHVFWVISLNTLFILMFAYCPYHLGKALFQNIKWGSQVSESHIDGIVNTITGYILFGFVFLFSHLVSSLMNMAKLSQLAKICYMCIKVAILLVFEAMVIPTVCGWWIDICSLSLLNATLSERFESYSTSPGTSIGFHWLFGMLFIFYFATFLLFTKEVLRPGLVWFMRNLNDPEFNPIREMMNQPVMRHIRRFLIAATVFGSIIVLIVWIPVKFLKWAMPEFLPYRVFAISDEPLNHVSLELVTLQVFLPTLLEQTHIKFFLKSVIRLWAELIGYMLDLRGYLLGEKLESGDNQEGNQERANQPGFLRGAANEPAEEVDDDAFNWNLEHINENRNEIRTHHLFHKPAYFKLRVTLLLILVALSLSSAAIMILYFPVHVGRRILETLVGHDRKIHEMYTLFLGLFVCWLPLLAITIVSRWAPMGWRIMIKKLGKRLKIGSKIALAFVTIAGGIALLFGLLFDLVFLTPLRVPLHQTPITYVLVDWAFGAVHVKIAVAFTLLGPNWWLRDALENIYNQGARNFQLKNFLWLVVWPVVSTLTIMLTIPYIISHGLLPMLPIEESLMLRFQRRVYPMFFFGALGMFMLHVQYQQLCRLIESIKNSKYLVGQRLVNYDPDKLKNVAATVENVH